MDNSEKNYSNIPNILTMMRIFLIPFIISLMYLPGSLANIMACILLFIACLTDYFDGYLARTLQQSTSFGRFLDPIADKLLVATILLALANLDKISGPTIIPAMVILCREILVSGLREHLSEITIHVTYLAKWKATVQMLAIGFLVFDGNLLPFLHIDILGIIGIWIAALLTLTTGFDYFKSGFKHL